MSAGFEIANSTSSAADADGNLSFSFDAGTSANRCLWVWVAVVGASSVGLATITYNGVSMTAISRAYNNGQNGLWYLQNPASGSNTLALSSATAGNDILIIGIVTNDTVQAGTPYTGLAVRGFHDTGETSGTTHTIATSTSTSDGLCLGFDSSGSSISGPNHTNRQTLNLNASSEVGNIAVQSDPGTGSGVTFTWSSNADIWTAVGLNVLSAGGPQAPTPISFHASGGRSAGGTTSLTITYPTVSANDFILMERTVKPNTATSTTPVSGFTAGINDTGGAAGDAQAADTGQTRETTEYKIATGSESGTVATTQGSTPSSACGFMLSYSKASDTYWSIVSASADDSGHGTARSHSFGNFDLQPGDMLVVVGASDTDTTTAYTSPTFTASGITFGTVNNRLATGGVTTGNDCGNWAYDALVSTGSSVSVAVSFALTAGPSSCGRAHLYRLRQVRPFHYGREPALVRVPRIVPLLARRRR